MPAFAVKFLFSKPIHQIVSRGGGSTCKTVAHHHHWGRFIIHLSHIPTKRALDSIQNLVEARGLTNALGPLTANMRIQYLPEGPACLNLGCGNFFFPEWTNTDISPRKSVVRWDLRRALPWRNDSFDATYSSHVLEHLTPDDGLALLKEQLRVLKSGGVCRVVVPDLETICREYLSALETANSEGTPDALKNYRWMQLELLDQMVRSVSGGAMRKILQSGEFNEGFVRDRMGEQFDLYYPSSSAYQPKRIKTRSFLSRLLKRLRSWFRPTRHPRESGELHLWMYDRLSLRLIMEEAGFVEFKVMKFDLSRIPYWGKYNLDKSLKYDLPRKPDSIYAEASKPSQ